MRFRYILVPILTAGTAAAQPANTSAPANPPAPTNPSDAANPSAPAGPGKPWSVAVEPRLGALISTSKLGPFAIGGLEIDVPVAMDHRLLVGLDASFTQPSHDGTVMDPRITGTGAYTIKETEVALALLASYRLAGAGAKLVPWVGAGPMLHLLESNETTNLAPGSNTATSTELGVELAGGADFRAGPGYLGGDLRFAYSKLDHTITGSTNAGHIALAVGYRLMF